MLSSRYMDNHIIVTMWYASWLSIIRFHLALSRFGRDSDCSSARPLDLDRRRFHILCMAKPHRKAASAASSLTKKTLSSHNKTASLTTSASRTPLVGGSAPQREHKRGKGAVLKCSRCRATSDATEWANKKAGAPTGIVCQRCHTVYTDGNFEIFGSFDELLKKMEDDNDLRQDFEKAEVALDNTTNAKFKQEQVSESDAFELFMEQSFLGLSRAIQGGRRQGS